MTLTASIESIFIDFYTMSREQPIYGGKVVCNGHQTGTNQQQIRDFLLAVYCTRRCLSKTRQMLTSFKKFKWLNQSLN